MKQNNWAYSNTPIDVYRVSSKGIRHVRTIIPGGKSKDETKAKRDEEKPDKRE